MKDLQKARKRITQGNKKIAGIRSAVDDLAFRANLLALNAATEAARADEEGRDFSAKATEVRSLTGRAIRSAQEIKKRIKDSATWLDNGNIPVNGTIDGMDSAWPGAMVVAGKTNFAIREMMAVLLQLGAAVKDIHDALEKLGRIV